MTFAAALVLLLLAAVGMAVVRRYLHGRVRMVCMAALGLAALGLACYLGLTLLFVDAVQNQPPAP